MMKKFKAFTLVELIVAIAVFGILMAGVVKMVEPLSSTAANASVLNNQRNVENAIVTYIGENLRYASNLAIIQGGTADQAVQKFIALAPADYQGMQIDYSNTPQGTANKNKIRVIAFDGSNAYSYKNQSFTGRVISKTEGKPTSLDFSYANLSSDGTKNQYLVFGDAYYAQGDYYLDARICGGSLCLSIDSDYYYTPNKNGKFSSTSGTPTKGTYELRCMTDDTDAFAFACFKSTDTVGSSLNTSQPATVTRTAGDVIYFVYTYSTYDKTNPDYVTNNGVTGTGAPGGNANCPTMDGSTIGGSTSGGSGGSSKPSGGNNNKPSGENSGGNSGGNSSGGSSGGTASGSISGGSTSGGDSGGTSGGDSGGSSGGTTGSTTSPVTVGDVTLSNGINGGNGVVGVTGAKQNSDGSVTITTTDKNGFNEGSFTISKNADGQVVYTFTVGKNWWVFSDDMGAGWKNEGESFVLNDSQISYLEKTYGIKL